MNWIRRIRPYLPALGLWFAAGLVDPLARAEDPAAASPPSTASADAESAKVHGTITVDFDKVTISELLKLVSVVEKVDGVIHIVSSHPREGEEAIVVSSAQGAVALARTSSPSSPKLVIGSVKQAAPAPSHVHQRPVSPAASGPEFPRIAALARLLGMEKNPEPALQPRVMAATTAGTIPASRVIPLEVEPAPSAPVVESSPAPSTPQGSATALEAGSRIGSLAGGEPIIVGKFHSPWPASENLQGSTNRTASVRDAEVSQASHSSHRAAVSVSPQKYTSMRGDTFESLSQKFYGDARYASALWWANRGQVTWPDALTAGKTIKIPGLGQLEPKAVMAQAHAKNNALPPLESIGPRRDPETVRTSFEKASTDPASPSTTNAGGFAVYVVRPEDTLRIIAREKCGDERKALEIIALNRDALSVEGRPRVGQCLILPAPATASPTH
ncbi:LysM peptidoglycan-binding domain-containing protein [Paludisphaera rhizosphaerae]|uniref:LysM peptidoglycan-binding domain-containing protein n=1 Tax=Paludisphaera rhizosphaerae TaxID=2711216 RepID=UPI0013EA2929|nr:LysM peptidoglycan-binding domain-containing protein [Paludisphaera rhizosphaerae]